MASWRRARRPEQKQERYTAILDAAAALVRARAMSEITIGAIAEGAGLAKGSVYRYFATKEEVLLAVLTRELEGWFTVTNEALRALAGQTTATDGPAANDLPALVAARIAGSLAERPLMTQLLAMLTNDLEHNLSREAARAFKEAALRQMVETGALLETALPALPPGAGGRFVMWLQVLISGIWPLAHPVGAVREVLETPPLAPLRVDFSRELEAMIGVLLRGVWSTERQAG